MQVLLTRPHADWVADVQQRYKALEQFSKEDARMQVRPRATKNPPAGNLGTFDRRSCEAFRRPVVANSARNSPGAWRMLIG
eukprot:12608-Pyramimonas_sp.AAC.1